MTNTTIEWKPIKGFTNYAVSSDGDIKNVKTGRILKTHLNKRTGYEQVVLRKDKHSWNKYVHRLVCDAFYENSCPEIYTDVNHKDFNRANNMKNNLEWMTHKQNLNYVCDEFAKNKLKYSIKRAINNEIDKFFDDIKIQQNNNYEYK